MGVPGTNLVLSNRRTGAKQQQQPSNSAATLPNTMTKEQTYKPKNRHKQSIQNTIETIISKRSKPQISDEVMHEINIKKRDSSAFGEADNRSRSTKKVSLNSSAALDPPTSLFPSPSPVLQG